MQSTDFFLTYSKKNIRLAIIFLFNWVAICFQTSCYAFLTGIRRTVFSFSGRVLRGSER